MSSEWHSDSRLHRIRRLTTAAIAANITGLLYKTNVKVDGFTPGLLLIVSETIENCWLKQCQNIKTYADQSKLFKSSMYRLKAGQFLREQGVVGSSTAHGKLEKDIDEIKKQLKHIVGEKRKSDEIAQ